MTKLPPISEKAFMAQVRQYARLRSWLVYHTQDSRRSPNGFPDLVCVRGRRVVFVEVKAAGGRLTADQKQWLAALAVAGAEVYCWRPKHWSEIERLLA